MAKIIPVKPAKATVLYEPVQAQLEAGKLSSVKNTLDVALVEDDEKDEKIRAIINRQKWMKLKAYLINTLC